MVYILLTIYFICLSYLLIFSINQFILTLNYRSKPKQESNEGLPDDLPFVTIQLPVYNEKFVIERLLDSIDRIQYPDDRLEVQILDDSTDETSQIIREFIQKKDRSYTHITRNKRQGYKAGALSHGLAFARGELIALFDADFVPNPDFLKKTLPYFSDGTTAMVQARWKHLNQNFSILTELQAFGLDAHFTVEQSGRYSAGKFINFNGTAGVWRKEAIIDAGGWEEDTLTEDLDLSYRAQLKGWKFHYLEDYGCPSELPVTVDNIKSQQFRWTKGTAETAVKMLPEVIKSGISSKQKVSAFFHLTSSLVFVSIFLTSVISVPLVYFKSVLPELKAVFLLGNVFVLGFILIAYFYWVSLQNSGYRLRNYIWRFPMFMSLSMSLGAQNTIATIEGLIGKRSAFIRTPKFNILTRKDRISKNNYLRSRISFTNILELLMTIYFGGAIVMGFKLEDLGLIIFHGFLLAGYSLISYFSIKELLYAKA